MQEQIKFTTRGSSTGIGNFAAGDLLRCSPAMASHFVNQARCAKYTQPPTAQAPKLQRKPSKPRQSTPRSS